MKTAIVTFIRIRFPEDCLLVHFVGRCGVRVIKYSDYVAGVLCVYIPFFDLTPVRMAGGEISTFYFIIILIYVN